MGDGTWTCSCGMINLRGNWICASCQKYNAVDSKIFIMRDKDWRKKVNMNDDLLKYCGRFIPMFDPVVNDVGGPAALVYGVIWELCKENGRCELDGVMLAQRTRLKSGEIRRGLQVLCEAGYIRNIAPTPDSPMRVYEDTGKFNITQLPKKGERPW